MKGDKKAVGEIVKYYEETLNYIPEFVRLLGKYSPDALVSLIDFRKSAMKGPPKGALSLKEKELIFVAIDSFMLNPAAHSHARQFIEEGGTVEELVEAITLASYIRGASTFAMVGTKMIKEAEKVAKNPGKRRVSNPKED
jgi:alkylhydroperoxidase/carboxymuconolactone decarboxylase family protein YurZ